MRAALPPALPGLAHQGSCRLRARLLSRQHSRGTARPGDTSRAAGEEQLRRRWGISTAAEPSENPVTRERWCQLKVGQRCQGWGQAPEPTACGAAPGNAPYELPWCQADRSEPPRVLQPFPSLTALPFSGKWGKGAAFIPVDISASPTLKGSATVAEPLLCCPGAARICVRGQGHLCKQGPQAGGQEGFQNGLDFGVCTGTFSVFISVSYRFEGKLVSGPAHV